MAQLPDMVAFLVAKNHRAGMSETLERLHALLLPHMSHIASIRAEQGGNPGNPAISTMGSGHLRPRHIA